jgi:tyrosyl-tRNA synthetase
MSDGDSSTAKASATSTVGDPEGLDELLAGAAAVHSADELRTRLRRADAEGRPLRVKLGIDPSRPDLHLGHAVVLRTLRRFQEMGHTAVLIIGDFTGLVGDPTGRSETRPMLTEEEVQANAQTYFEQAGRVLDLERAEVRRNSEWLGALTMRDVLRLAASLTVARMLERDDFRQRYESGAPISVVEFTYPLMQGYDSVAVRADVEMGGTDQTFNLLVGRDIQRAYGQEPQVVFTMPLLVGTDGERKMSKSFDNYIGVTDPPEEMFGRAMSIPDAALDEWERLATSRDPAALGAIPLARSGLPEAAARKRRLAKAIVADFWGSDEADRQEERFDRVHREGAVPEDVATAPIMPEWVRDGRAWLPRLLVGLGLATSNADARRKVAEGAVRLDGGRLDDPDAEIAVTDLDGRVLQVGRRHFVRVVAGGRSAP